MANLPKETQTAVSLAIRGALHACLAVMYSRLLSGKGPESIMDLADELVKKVDS